MKTTRSLSFDDVLLRPRKTPVRSRDDVDLGTAFTRHLRLDIPLVSANMSSVTEVAMANAMAECGGLGVLHRFCSESDQREMAKAIVPPIAVALSLKQSWDVLGIDGVRVAVLDVAHAHSDEVIQAIKDWERRDGIDLMVGNIATAEAARDLCEAGADGLKVGIGPSPVCRTRDVAGAGVGQLTAVAEVAHVAQEYGVPVCADGGLATSGDIVKALAAGASTVMSGSLFVGCDESPARQVKCDDGVVRKEYFGSASGRQKEGNDYIEGSLKLVEKTGPIRDVVKRLCDGIRSGVSYGGGRTISQMQANAHFEVIH